ncbi:MAG: hypothetical protein QG675_554 [Patescibacteria group bacterium]|jgi:hypothetical protein|nr:hypothetical protein [Patescibacteria group bacterium]
MDIADRPVWIDRSLMGISILSALAMFVLVLFNAKPIYAIPFLIVVFACFVVRIFFWWGDISHLSD